MSKAPEKPNTAPTPQPAAAPVPRNSPNLPQAVRRLDPAAVLIGIGGAVLIMALWWLLVTPRSSADGGADAARLAQIEQRLTALEPVKGEAGAMTARIRALEERPLAADLRPVEGRVRALEERPVAADMRPVEARLGTLTERLGGTDQGLAQAGERAAAAERRLQALEARPVFDPAALTARLTAQAAALEQRVAALDATVQQRVAAADAAIGQRMAALDAASQRLAAIEARTGRLAAVEAVRAALAAGQPLGAALGRLGEAPAALSRFAQAAPPTEAGLRLSFEAAAATARAASDAGQQADGGRGGVVDSALARLGGLVTVRRGDQVVWGDAAEAEIERTRRALEAGDLALALSHVGRLPPAAKAALRPWAEQAEALIAARAALSLIVAG